MVLIKIFYKILLIIKNFYELILNLFIVKIMKVNISFDTLKNINGKLFVRNKGHISIGNNVRINSNYMSNPIGGNCVTSIVVIKDAKLTIEDGVGISNTAIVCHNKINIGKNVFIGGDCKIYDTDFHSLNYNKRICKNDDDIKTSPVYIKDGAFIGAGTTILKGVTIGERSIIGAGSVVTKDIPDNEIWAGNVVKFIRKIQVNEDK